MTNSRILVIDDDADLRSVISGILEVAGYQVGEAGDGREGLESYRRRPADLVLTDIIMPDQEGVETILQLKREFPDVRIIAMSGGGRTAAAEILSFADKFGAQETLEKPFSRDRLLTAVDRVLTESGPII